MPKKTQKLNSLDELKIIDDLSALFSSTLDLNTTLHETVELVSKVTGADACFLYLYNPFENLLVLSASKTPHPKEIGHLSLKMGEGITGWVAEHHRPVAIPKGAHKDPRFIGALPEDRFEAFLSVPILIKNKVVGVINAQHKKIFVTTPRLINLLSTIGRQVGGAIETARLYQETQKRAKAIEALKAVSFTLVQDHYSEDIMQRIIQMTAQLMGTNICSIMLLDEKKKELQIVASQSLDPEYRNKPPVKVMGSLSGQAVLSKQPVYTQDVRKESSYQYRDLAKRQGLVSMLAVPMIFKNKVLGLLNSYKPEIHHFSKEEVAFVQSVANQCAAAIENTRLLSEKVAAQEALESRKIIDRAKGLLMTKKNISENQAFREIRQQSMDRRRSMKEIAEAIILAFEIGEKDS
ncbi:hypothetical protein BVX98_08030 [bacterium F11]|nr:hypothetical protein BVX98_08030 [bacterium F11]